MLHKSITKFSVLMMVCIALSPASADNVDDYLNAQMKKHRIPGLSMAVVRAGKVVMARGYGMADVERSVPATPDTVYEIGSITKQFTSAAIMLLVEDGKINLDNKISTYLPNLPETWNKITVRNLLTHTSGIKNYTDLPNFNLLMRIDTTKEDILKTVSSEPLQFSSGEKWGYSNTGYFLLGMILEKVSGHTYGKFLEMRIFEPLGMAASRVNDHSLIIPNRACGYTMESDTLRNCTYISMTWPFSAGVLVSTVKDMAKWDNALYTTKLLKQSSLQQLWTRVKLNNGKTANYGFGWGVEDFRGHRHINHSGGIPGFVSHISRFVDDQLTVIIFTNTDQANPGAIALGVAGLIIPALSTTSVPSQHPIAPKSIVDKDPETTRHLRDVVLGIEDDKADSEQFSPKARALLFPTRIKMAADNLKQLGLMKSFLPVEQSTVDKRRDYRYRVEFGDTGLIIHFVLSSEGKIEVIQLLSE